MTPPEILWAYDEPNLDGSNHHVVMSEQAISTDFYPFWKEAMRLKGLEHLVSVSACLEDWVAVHWAYRVDPEAP